MKQTKHILFYLSLLAVTTLIGCDSVLDDDDSTGNQGGTMELSFTRSGESSSFTSGFLIFWKEKMDDFFTTEVSDLTAYSTTKYNTGEPYPKEGTKIFATGFSPANMNLSTDYQTLGLPENSKPGTLDVCAAAKAIQGNYYSTFNEAMTFEHTLTKIVFKAKRNYTMEGNRLVNNIKVTIPRNFLPVQWQWNHTKRKYEADLKTPATTEYAPIMKEALTEIDKEYIIAECYLMLPTGNNGYLQNIKMEADLRKVGATSTEVEHKTWDLSEGIPLYEEDGQTLVEEALKGEAYEIVFNFTNDSFILQAYKQPWEQGGLITIPIDPDGGESNHSNN